MATLFAIGQDLQAIDELLDAIGGDISQPDVDAAITQWLTDTAAAEAEKLEAYYRLIRSRETAAAVAKEEAERCNAIYKAHANAAERLKGRLLDHMGRTGKAQLVTASGHKFWLQKNGGKPPLDVDVGLDLDAIDQHYVKVAKSLNTDAVRADLEDGLDVPFAKLGERGSHLRCK